MLTHKYNGRCIFEEGCTHTSEEGCGLVIYTTQSSLGAMLVFHCSRCGHGKHAMLETCRLWRAALPQAGRLHLQRREEQLSYSSTAYQSRAGSSTSAEHVQGECDDCKHLITGMES